MLPRWARGPMHARRHRCFSYHHHYHTIPQSFTSFSCLSAASRKFGSMVPRRASIRELGSITGLRVGLGCGRLSDLYKSAAMRTWDARLSSYRRERKKAVTGPDRSAPKFPHTTSARRRRHSGICIFSSHDVLMEFPALFHQRVGHLAQYNIKSRLFLYFFHLHRWFFLKSFYVWDIFTNDYYYFIFFCITACLHLFSKILPCVLYNYKLASNSCH